MRRLPALTLMTVVLAGFLSVAQSQGQPEQVVQPEIVTLSLPVDGSPTDLVVHIYKPSTPGATRFPLVLYAHGRQYNPNPLEPSPLAAPINVGTANWWLQEGFAVVAPLRPGYGKTGGFDREQPFVYLQGNTCVTEPKSINPLYDRAALKGGEVILATLAWAQRQPWVIPDRIMLVGFSFGGVVTMAVASTNPRGVVGAVNFGGGMGANPAASPRKPCRPDLLTAAYGRFGKTARMPSLWLYAENDLLWGVDIPHQWFDAFKAGGSNAIFVQTPPVPGEGLFAGHLLIDLGGPLWHPSVEVFLRKMVGRSGGHSPASWSRPGQ